MHSRKQFIRVKRFQNVIVCARFQACDPVVIGRARREHDHWYGRLLSQMGQHFEPVDHR